jgi:hypothetical protein
MDERSVPICSQWVSESVSQLVSNENGCVLEYRMNEFKRIIPMVQEKKTDG